MSDERKITEVRNYKRFERSKVAIYCRVSTRSQEQLESLANQVSSLTRFVAHRGGWTLVDTYIDFRSGKDVSNRTEFQRMLTDCAAHKIDLIVT